MRAYLLCTPRSDQEVVMIARWLSRRLEFVFRVSPEMHAAIQASVALQAEMWS